MYIKTFSLLRAGLLLPAALVLAGLLPAAPAQAQWARGTVQESLTMPSDILGQDVSYTIYLPPDYDASNRLYPVVYLLHGYTDDDTGWLQFGEANRIADEGINQGEIPPMIIVMPDGGVSWYVNDYKGEVRWADMFVEEFMPHIESTYRIRAQKAFRGIAGLSMGGYGALVNAMRRPDLFAAVAAFSSGVWTDAQMASFPQESYERTYGILYGAGLQGEDRLTDHWRAHSVIDLVNTTPADQLKSVRYFIDCGDDDFLAIGNAMLHVGLLEKEIPHEYRVRDGAHTWSYWRAALPVGLKFIGQSFHR